MEITPQQAARLLKDRDNIVIFAHRKPDGDTLGSAFALLHALEHLGKAVRIECPDPIIHGHLGTIFGAYQPREFEAEYVVAVDVAGPSLLCGVENRYGGKVHLCIDHHKSNEGYADNTLLDPSAAATAEIVHEVIKEMEVPLNRAMADALFTGITTDTGGFRFANVTANTHRVAAELIARGADHVRINKLMFQTKSRGRLEVDRLLLDSLSYHFDGRCAIVYVPAGTAERFGVGEGEMDGISAFPRTIEGVVAGITLREREEGDYRVSVRTEAPVDASKICATFGGGGHANAAGCTLKGALVEAKEQILAAVARELAEKQL